MIRPAVFPLVIIRRSSFDFAWRVYDTPDGELLDLTGIELLAQMWDRARETKYLDMTVDTSEVADGLIRLTLASDQTIQLPSTGVYDLKAIYPNGKEYFLVKGGFTVQEGYTDD